ncbi:sigma-70 family RNA polymerase sigma factor [Clostridium sp. HBUAS56017]|uniref:sigma-70 family RNA polymerase sigma factor n=1 Tax=Clostridium sp. HBUAS56017 TaxID=2571128 RepID=UPI0011773884|nr:sigma-70 family RNA polymerase sigma factor [Clostridium sp. HBUAS56017]
MGIKAEDHLRLVHSIAQKIICPQGVEYEDIVQIGCIGLIKAIKNFDTSYNVQFSTYAFPMIKGEIRKFLRDDGLVKINRNTKTLGNKVRFIRTELNRNLNREPTSEEIAEVLDENKADVEKAIKASQSIQYLYDTVYHKDGQPILLIDKIGEEGSEEREEDIVNKLILKESIESLDDKSKKVMYLRYFASETQIEVARILGISQVQVSRIERKAINNIKEIFEGGSEMRVGKVQLVFSWLDRNFSPEKERKDVINKLKNEFGISQNTAASYLTSWKKQKSNLIIEEKSVNESKIGILEKKTIGCFEKPKKLKVTNLSVEGENGDYKVTEENVSLFDGESLIIAFRDEKELDEWYQEIKSLFKLKATIA